jgi:integrase
MLISLKSLVSFLADRAHVLFFALFLVLGGVFGRGEYWYIDYYYRGHRCREKVGRSKGQAVQALSVRESEIAQGKFKLLSKRGGLTFEGLVAKYRDLVAVHKRGYHVERYILKTLNTFFGKYKVHNLSAEDAEKYKGKRSQQVKPATVNRELTLAKHIMAKAAEWKLVVDNPFRGVRNLGVPKRGERVLTDDEEIKLLAACDRVRSLWLRPLILLALNTGMRRGELLGLEWSRVDLEQRTIRIINAKSTAGNRVIPMNATVYSLLSELVTKATSPLLFPSNRRPGEKLLDLKKGFKKAVRLSGIAHFRWHDMRHTFATRLVRAGVDIISVQHLLGHSKITMTARYAHSLADVKMAAVCKLDLAGSCSLPDSNRTPGPKMQVPEPEAKPLQSSTIGP